MSATAAARVPPRRPCLSRRVRAFNANQTSWVGLGVFVIVRWRRWRPLLHRTIRRAERSQARAAVGRISLGTDDFGRDILARLLYGARVSLVIGFVSTAIAMLIGSLIGLLAGWYGGRFDTLVMQAMDVLLAFPSLILGLIIVAMLGPSTDNIILAIALTSVPPFARIARAPTIALKERDYIEACRALGFSDAAHPHRARPAQHLRRDPGHGLALARQCASARRPRWPSSASE